jgi:lysophospholipase L1-like esterase
MNGQTEHVVLLGDSIFDNRAYVPGEPDVVTQLGSILPHGAKATLLAQDGAVTASVDRQLACLPAGASWLVVSAGGNDALGETHLLRQACSSVGEGIAVLGQAQRRFAQDYERMVIAVRATGVPAALCTIYDANYAPPEGAVVTTALSLFNDVITRAAFASGLPLVDLRLICSEPTDYANPIEPSARGGEKIAHAIARLVGGLAAGSSRVVA